MTVQGDARKATSVGLPLLLEPPVLECLRKGFLASGLQVPPLAPHFPGRKKHRARGEGLRPGLEVDAVLDPFANDVLVLEILVGHVADDGRRRQPELLPFEAAVDAPPQDGRPFGLELLRQVWVALFWPYLDRERDDEHHRRIASSTVLSRGLWLPTM